MASFETETRVSLDIQDPRSILSGILSLRAETTMSFQEGYEGRQNRQVPNQLPTKSGPSKPLTKRGSLMVFQKQVTLRQGGSEVLVTIKSFSVNRIHFSGMYTRM